MVSLDGREKAAIPFGADPRLREAGIDFAPCGTRLRHALPALSPSVARTVSCRPRGRKPEVGVKDRHGLGASVAEAAARGDPRGRQRREFNLGSGAVGEAGLLIAKSAILLCAPPGPEAVVCRHREGARYCRRIASRSRGGAPQCAQLAEPKTVLSAWQFAGVGRSLRGYGRAGLSGCAGLDAG